MGLFSGGNSKSSSSTDYSVTTPTANQVGGSSPVIGGLSLASSSDGKGSDISNTTLNLSVPQVDFGSVQGGINVAGDAAARAAGLTASALALLGQERESLVATVGQLGNASAMIQQQAAQQVEGAQQDAQESLAALAKRYQVFLWLAGLAAAGVMLWKR